MAAKKISNLNLPNILTVIRIVLVPFFIVLLLMNSAVTDVWATIIFVIASVTDFFDGYLARSQGLVTPLGKIIDPIADKVLVAAALVALVELGRLEGWIVIVLLSREFVVGALRDYASSKGVIIAALFIGKFKTVLQMWAIGCLIWWGRFLGMDTILVGTWSMYVAMGISVYSIYPYFLAFSRMTDE